MIKNIGILSFSSPKSGGIFQYTISLLEAFKLLLNKYNTIQIRTENFPKILNKEIIIKEKSSKTLKIKRILSILTNFKFKNLTPNATDNFDLIISPITSFMPLYMYKPYIITIHDFQHKYYPEFFSPKERIIRSILYQKTAKKALFIVCESNYVKQDIINFLGIEHNKIHVIPSPPPKYIFDTKINSEKLNFIKNKYDLTKNFLFYPAQFWYHKNHINLIKALHLIKVKYKQSINLVLVGSKKNNFENVIKEIQNLGLTEQVKYLGYIPNEDMPYLYKLATALVMPTLFESVSMPIWEAFYLGCPVVSSNVCALPEQIGDAGLLFNPNNIEDIAEKIYKIFSNESLRATLIEKGHQKIKNFTIENYALQWDNLLNKAFQIIIPNF